MSLCCFVFQPVSTWEGCRHQLLHCGAFLHLLPCTWEWMHVSAETIIENVSSLFYSLADKYTSLSTHQMPALPGSIIFVDEVIGSPSLPLNNLKTTSDGFTSERSHLFSLASHLHLSLSLSPRCSVEFSKPRRCCIARRHGQAQDEKEERRGEEGLMSFYAD